MIDIRVIIKDLPVPTDRAPVRDLVGEVQRMVDEVDNGVASQFTWRKIDNLYRKLKAIKVLNDQQTQLLELIVPVMEKYNHAALTPSDLSATKGGKD